MSRRAEGLLLVLVGLVAFRLVLTGTYDQYVRAGMRLPLLAASAFLVVLGAWTTVTEALREDRGEASDGGHHHGRPLVGWFLLLPLAVLVTVAPAALGADAATRQRAYQPAIERVRYGPLPEARAGAVDLRLAEFVDRALWDAGNSLDGTTVRLTGFVVHDEAVPDGFLLTRFQIACCAADAVPVKVAVPDPPSDPADDQWVQIVGRLVPLPAFDEQGDLPMVAVEVDELVVTAEPESPYE